MLTMEGLIAVISLCLTAFGLGYAIGSKDNNVIGLVTNAWSPVFPIIFLFCVLLVTVCKLLIEKRESK
ncbi:MAG: hypothetical protein Q4D94_14315 [Bacillota bacterium]|nr:hypothetical protein [Bacillota bacterium]